MKNIILFILFLPLIIKAQPLTLQTPVRFLALGDSYTIGQSVPAASNWPNQLKDSLAVRGITMDTLRIIATTGWRTDNLISAITGQGLDSGHFNLVSLLIGVNNQYQGTPFSQFVSQFPQLVDSAIRYAGEDTSHVFIVSIPDYAYTPYGLSTGDTAMISAQLDTYNLVARQFADSFHIRFFNITPISQMGLANPALVTTDGLHPSGLQYSMWISLMLQAIDSAAIDTTVSTGLAPLSPTSVSVYPNPTTDNVTITLDRNIANARLELYDMMGQQLDYRELRSSTTLFLANFPMGIYTLRLSSRSEKYITRITKE